MRCGRWASLDGRPRSIQLQLRVVALRAPRAARARRGAAAPSRRRATATPPRCATRGRQRERRIRRGPSREPPRLALAGSLFLPPPPPNLPAARAARGPAGPQTAARALTNCRGPAAASASCRGALRAMPPATADANAPQAQPAAGEATSGPLPSSPTHKGVHGALTEARAAAEATRGGACLCIPLLCVREWFIGALSLCMCCCAPDSTIREHAQHARRARWVGYAHTCLPPCARPERSRPPLPPKELATLMCISSFAIYFFTPEGWSDEVRLNAGENLDRQAGDAEANDGAIASAKAKEPATEQQLMTIRETPQPTLPSAYDRGAAAIKEDFAPIPSEGDGGRPGAADADAHKRIAEAIELGATFAEGFRSSNSHLARLTATILPSLKIGEDIRALWYIHSKDEDSGRSKQGKKRNVDTNAVVLVSGSTRSIYVTFRGTDSTANIITDLEFLKTRVGNARGTVGPRCHHGFHDAYYSMGGACACATPSVLVRALCVPALARARGCASPESRELTTVYRCAHHVQLRRSWSSCY